MLHLSVIGLCAELKAVTKFLKKLFHCEVVFNGTPLATTIVGKALITFKSVQHMLLVHLWTDVSRTKFVLSHTE